MTVEIRFDPALVEEAVFLELKNREASGDRRMAEAFHAQRSLLYDATGAAEEREARFQQLAERAFHELGFAEFVTERFEEVPLVAAHVPVARVQRVWSRKEERVELYVRPTTLLLGLQAARYLNRGELVAFLRHELMHIGDMLDPAFAYEPHPAFGGECETENDLIRERFRLLWNLFVNGRMRRNGWPLPDAERSHRGLDPSTQAPALAGGSRSGFRPTGVLESATGLPVGLHQAFASWQPRRREAAVQDLSRRDRCTQHELLELAKDERLTRMLGAGGVRCPLCHFPTRDGVRAWDGEWAPIAQAIHADYPDWTPSHGACLQCAELYRARRCLTR